MASAVAGTLPAGTNQPLMPSWISSGTPAMYVPKTGRPVARASIIATGKFSAKLGMTRARLVRKCSRTSALLARVTTFTTIAGAEAAVEGMKYIDKLDVCSLQELHSQLM